ncbi:4-hydroxy-3-methylbut-2-enyl diphosphate reductase [Dyadobacter sediminis]|uniref:4-hydroxy-3-methylbut-2-enyl diphosphate reductase n=1 Tax=Dyadobacter sediminis TaxID=1493691 RepID=A0A5R9K7Y9_9BACT|nr:4-hydroxy-3-methylbut-2-enyl diphosphate reductase [Dyadobacter sediminis]TLU89964.1 4-hydroxy-3-methylbut-2-enyl diphosphate reductase [Dyadobacter sediminis]GGC11323.1 4-hydroxy-3-methylbut-2-enyl diphosphate reductase [Dyadobacter sediminis]
MKTFNIPDFYRSRIITPIKEFRRKNDKLKRDYAPTLLDFGPVQFLIARHFGFCYGVENAIDIAYKAINENPDRRIFLLSEMIHNPDVNRDLTDRGVRFMMDTKGNQLIPWEELTPEDIVIVPAFGTTVENQKKLAELGINSYVYDTTCPFVEKVWNRAAQIGEKDYTIIVHGKPNHEETRATFSHSKENAPTIVIKDLKQAVQLAKYMTGEVPLSGFATDFQGQFSEGFDPKKDLQRIGVVNQTTMLASDTQGIADYLKNVMIKHYALKPEQVEERFANTRDTLCYATNDNQDATYALLTHQADLVIVAGGYNSSNTSHLVELCEQKFPTYFIESVNKLLDNELIRHFDLFKKEEVVTKHYLPETTPARIMLTCGASCPDAVVEAILMRLLSFFEGTKPVEEVMQAF